MKKINKKILAALIITTLVLLTACGGSNDNANEQKQDSTQAEQTSMQKSDSQSKADKKDNDKPLIDETVLVDQNDVKITALDLYEDDYFGMTLKVLIENNSDKDIVVSYPKVAVNNYMVSQDLMISEVASGNKDDQEIFVLPERMINAGITDIADIDIVFNVADDNSFETIFETDYIKLKTKQFDSIEKKKLDDGKEIYNKDGVRIVAKYAEETAIGTNVIFFMENNSGKFFTITCDSIAIDGNSLYPFFRRDIDDGRYLIADVLLSMEEFEKSNASKIKNVDVEFSFVNFGMADELIKTGVLSFSY